MPCPSFTISWLFRKIWINTDGDPSYLEQNALNGGIILVHFVISYRVDYALKCSF